MYGETCGRVGFDSYQNRSAFGLYTVDDLVGDIMSDSAARTTLMDVLVHANVPDCLKVILATKRNNPLQQAPRMMPNSNDLLAKLTDLLGGFQ